MPVRADDPPGGKAPEPKTPPPKPPEAAKPPGGPPGAPSAESKAMIVKPGAVEGSIVDLDGKTPVSGAKVQLLDDSGKVVHEGTTDSKGAFKIPDVPKGNYNVKIGDATGKLVLQDGAGASALKFVLDPAVAKGEKKGPPAALVPTDGGDGTLIVVAIIAGLLLIGGGIGIALALGGKGGGSGSTGRPPPVSPTKP